ncbi:MAG: hypothetical protein V4665_01735 [Patescibacteria group bacterium]
MEKIGNHLPKPGPRKDNTPEPENRSEAKNKVFADLYDICRELGVDIGVGIHSPEDAKNYLKENPEKITDVLVSLKRKEARSPSAIFKNQKADIVRILNFFKKEGYVQEETRLYQKNSIPDSLKGTHLENAERDRIKLRMYDSSDPKQYIRFALGEGAGRQFIEGTLVNYYDDKENTEKQGMRGGFPGYVISGVDESPKRSHSYKNCSSILAVAEDKETGKQISFLSHQNPSFFLSTEKENFKNDLAISLAELVLRAKPGTIDIGIMGGNYYDSVNNENKKLTGSITNAEQYRQAIPHLQEMIRASLQEAGREVPVVVMAGADYSHSPSMHNDTDLVLDTQARLLLAARPKQFYSLSDEIYDSADNSTFINSFDKNKILFKKPFSAHHSGTLKASARIIADAYKRAGYAEGDVTPFEERQIHRRLKDILGVRTFSLFERPDVNETDTTTVDLSLSPHEVLLFGKEAERFQKQKIDTIPNISFLLKYALDDMIKISEDRKQIMSPQESFSYTCNKDSGSVRHFIGGRGGFRHIEKAETQEQALVQNIASFIKSFHTFLDNFVTPETRNHYMELLHTKAKERLKEHLGKDLYRSLTEAF